MGASTGVSGGNYPSQNLSGSLNRAILADPTDTLVLELHWVVDRGHGSGCLRDFVRDSV